METIAHAVTERLPPNSDSALCLPLTLLPPCILPCLYKGTRYSSKGNSITSDYQVSRILVLRSDLVPSSLVSFSVAYGTRLPLNSCSFKGSEPPLAPIILRCRRNDRGLWKKLEYY